MADLKPFEFSGLQLSILTKTELLNFVRISLQTEERLLIGNANIHALNLAHENKSFRQALKSFNIVFCDGFGLKLGARLTGQIIPERFTPPDFIDEMMQIIRDQQGSVYLLGAVAGVAERAARTLVSRTEGLQIAGCMHGYFDKNPGSPDNTAVINQINSSQPALLLVAFGMPQQEEWLAQNWPDLDVRVAMTVGALFDIMAGDVPRAPRWMTDHGLEWFGRLLVEPGRLWRRYLIGNPLFFWRIFREYWSNVRSKSKIQ